MDTAAVIKYAKLTAKKRELQSMLKEIDQLLTSYREALLAQFGEDGIQSLKVDVDGKKTSVFVRKTIWANAVDGDVPRAVKALKLAGLGHLVEEKFNTHTLSAWLREQIDMQNEIPPQLEGAIKITEKYDLGVVKG